VLVLCFLRSADVHVRGVHGQYRPQRTVRTPICFARCLARKSTCVIRFELIARCCAHFCAALFVCCRLKKLQGEKRAKFVTNNMRKDLAVIKVWGSI
jgi:hypothetical protein